MSTFFTGADLKGAYASSPDLNQQEHMVLLTNGWTRLFFLLMNIS
jgi:hypothetical protein